MDEMRSDLRVLGIIPARFASSRFPGKPLVVIDGKTMIRRVYEQAKQCLGLTHVVVATDNQAIYNHVKLFNGEVIMTSEKHGSGTERCCEVISLLAEQGDQYDYVVNIQGDEPYINPIQIEELTRCLTEGRHNLATLARQIRTKEELFNPNVVKVVTDCNGYAMYFSRSPIPFTRGKEQEKWLESTGYFKHIGIYGYSSDVLKAIVSLPSADLETAESLEQLRWMENGFRIAVKRTEYESIAVDTPADLLKIANRDSGH
jgi:3-deoxy-manno-octulosonate cytidylyltransferase (CMP-KDO synthetase)